MKILIFGSKGFIGRNLQKKLSTKYQVFCADILEINSEKAQQIDILDRNKVQELLQLIEPDIILNLAAKTDLKGKNLTDYDLNWIGSLNIYESISELKISPLLIHFSSMLVCRMGYTPKDMEDYQNREPVND